MSEIIIMSFDIGEKNFCCSKTSIDLSQIQLLKPLNIPFKQRYDKNFECLPEFSQLLKKLSLLGKQTFIDKCDITHKSDKKYGKRRIITNRLLIRLNNYLEDLNTTGVFDDVSYFLIEKQVAKASNNQQLQYHLRAYLLLLFLNFRPIIMFPSKFKTQILGAPKKILNKSQKSIKMTYSQRKKFSRDTVFQILTNRNDLVGLDQIFSKKKTGAPSDVCDCLLQTEAFLYMVFIDDRKDILDC